MHSEFERLHFVEQRDGLAGALAFARQTMVIYRKAVMLSRKRGHEKPHFASLPEYRRQFIESYLVFKRFVAEFG